MKRIHNGSITVFLSLIMLLILAVIMTTVEAARASAAKTYTERALAAAMDSVLAEYYLPLFEEYHVFVLDAGYGEASVQTETVTSRLNDYMEYTFSPEKDLYPAEDYIPFPNVNLFGLKTVKSEVKKEVFLTDYDGELFTGEAVDYMKYRKVGDIAMEFLDKKAAVKEYEHTKPVLDKKQETEEKLYEIDKKILGLMRLVDGISISEKGVKTNSRDKIIIKDNFVKKISIIPFTKLNSGIENELVYSSLSGYFVNPQRIIDTAVITVDALIENIGLKESAINEYDSLTAIDQSDMDEEEREELSDRIESAWEQVKYYSDRESELSKSLNSNLKNLNTLVNGTLSTITDALPIVDELIIRQGEVTGEIQDYEALLQENRLSLDENFYMGLSEDLTEMQRYKKTSPEMDGNVGNYDFQTMKETLLHNRTILEGIKEYPAAVISVSTLDALKNTLLSDKNSFDGYSHTGLQFHYAGLMKPAESDSFFKCIRTLVEDGIVGLVTDTEEISGKEINEGDLPTFLHRIGESSEPADLSADLADISLDSKIGSLTDMFSISGEDEGLGEAAVNAGEAIGKLLLFQEYLMEHFDSFHAEEAQNSLKALDYELEYILMGRTTDYANLKAVIMRILLIRTIVNFITLIADSKSSGEARTLAISFVGFTGLPALVCVVKAMILFIWAFAESLIDIAALLEGKTIPLYKNGTQLQLGLYELYLINKTFIKSKADSMKEYSGGLQLNYRDYLKVFLYLERQENKSYRALDLIQENLQLKYEDNFYIKNCLFGFQAEAEFRMNSRFITLPFVRELLPGWNDGYSYRSSQEYSY